MSMITDWQSVIILVINKSDSRCAVVRFCYHSYDYRPDSTQYYYHYLKKILPAGVGGAVSLAMRRGDSGLTPLGVSCHDVIGFTLFYFIKYVTAGNLAHFPFLPRN